MQLISSTRLLALFFAVLSFSVSLPAFGQTWPPCKAIDRWAKGYDYWPDHPYPLPYPVYKDEGRVLTYDYANLVDGEDIQIYSDRYYAMPSLADMAYRRDTAQDFSFKQRAESILRCRLTARNDDDRKVTKFIKKKRVDGLAMDMILKVKNVDGMPVYRLGIRPLNFALDDHPELVYAQLNRESAAMNQRFVPVAEKDLFFSLALPDTAGQGQGELRFSDWQFCEPCMLRFITAGKRPHDFMPINPRERTDHLKNDEWVSINAYPVGRLNGIAEGVPDFIPAEVGLKPIQFTLAASPFRWADIRYGDDALEQAASLAWRYRQAGSRNREYNEFISSAFTPLTVDRHMKKARCPEIDNPSWGEGPSEYARAGNEAIARANCLSDHLATYDALPLLAIYEDIVREEELLFAATLGLKRAELPTPEQQFNAQVARIEGLMNTANRFFDTAEYTARRWEEQRQANAAKRAAMQSAYLGMQQQIGSMQAQVEQIRRDNEAFAALEIQKARRRQWEQEREVSLAARQQAASAQQVGATRPAGNALEAGSAQPAYEGFDRVPEISAGTLPCADIPTPEEVRKLEAGTPVPGFDAGWEDCVNRSSASAISASANDSAGKPPGGAVADTGSAAASTGGPGQNGIAGSDSGDEVLAQGSPSSVSGGAAGSSGSGSSGDGGAVAEVDRAPRYVFVRELYFEHKGFAFSSEAEARRGLQGAWASNALTDFCEEAWEGGDAHNGVVDISEISVTAISNSRWIGSARVDGYCRLLAHDADYDNLRACPSERRGQPNCYVNDRY